jgi:hypothetical protein
VEEVQRVLDLLKVSSFSTRGDMRGVVVTFWDKIEKWCRLFRQGSGGDGDYTKTRWHRRWEEPGIGDGGAGTREEKHRRVNKLA